MVDTIDQPSRSRVMARVKGKNTGPELWVRKMVFAAGYRYRIHVKNLPGSPDLTFPGRKKSSSCMDVFGIGMRAVIWLACLSRELIFGAQN